MNAKRKKPPEASAHTWEFQARFRANAFGWRSQPAVQRVKQAVSEIRNVARYDPALAAEGAVRFLERVSPAIARVDSSSGSMGNAVKRAIKDLVPIIAAASVEADVRAAWLERLWQAILADAVPYIEELAEHWGELCVAEEIAAPWAERLLDRTRIALAPDRGAGSYFEGTAACLTALLRAGRYDDLLDLLRDVTFWPYKRWEVKGLIAMGRFDEAIALAESSRALPSSVADDLEALCEEAMLGAGRIDEAYACYGLRRRISSTNLAAYRALAKRYPHKQPETILRDLIRTTPGDEGKWFASAKSLGLYDLALELARSSPCDPKTLARAARDLAEKQPSFATEIGYAALRWLVAGHGYDITSAEVWLAYQSAIQAAENLGSAVALKQRIRDLVSGEAGDRLVTRALGAELDLPRRR